MDSNPAGNNAIIDNDVLKNCNQSIEDYNQ